MDQIVKSGLTVVRRADIDAIHSIVENGKTVDLGELRDFRKDPAIAAFLPETARPSLAWTKLAPAGILPVHQHPTKTMVIVAQGQGDLIGDVEMPLEAGDVVCISPGVNHGFVAGDNDLHCLSLQFEGDGLYENADTPRAQFTQSVFEQFTALNQEYCSRWTQFIVGETNEIMKNESHQAAFWGHIKRWSTSFQHLLYVRQLTTDLESPLYELFREHFREEFDHDLMIKVPRAEWDPIIDACSAWFETAIAKGAPVEKLILVHSVLEAAGDIFSTELRGQTSDLERYVNVHHEHDEGHADMGGEFLKPYVEYNFNSAKKLLVEGWEVFFTMFERINALSKA